MPIQWSVAVRSSSPSPSCSALPSIWRSRSSRVRRGQITDYIEDSEGSSVVPLEHSPEEGSAPVRCLDCTAKRWPSCLLSAGKCICCAKCMAFHIRKFRSTSGIAISTVEKHLTKAIEQCDRYVRERVESRASPRGDLRRSQEVMGAGSEQCRGIRGANVDPASGSGVAGPDGRG